MSSLLFKQVAQNMALVADDPYVPAMERAIELLASTFEAGHTLLIFGNGGSSADAQHLCAELVVRFERDRRPLPAIALTTNQALITAVSNDQSFDEVFARQVEALGRPGDVALAISTSGRSPNVLRGLARARASGLRTIGLTGQAGTDMARLCDVALVVPFTNTARIQEVHLVTYHAICAALEQRLFDR